jgi:DNA polymerase-1
VRAFDLETEGLDPHQHRPVLLTIGDDRDLLQVDLRPGLPDWLRPLLQEPPPKVGHHAAFDAAMLRSLGVRAEPLLDTMLIEQVLRGGRDEGGLSLSALAERYLGLLLDKTLQTSFAGVAGEFSPAQLEYARRDVLAAFHILLEQTPRCEADGLSDTSRLECEAVPAFADLAYDGIHMDREAWGEIVREARDGQEMLRAEIRKHLAGLVPCDLFGVPSMNLESDAEWREVFSRILGRPVRELNKSALQKISHPLAGLLVRYREQSKIASTYGENLLQFVHARTGRIHAQFVQIGAPTGRVACRDPNLQSIPRGSRFRRCFRAPPGRRMVTADYSGCELRILAEVSRDPAFVQTFQRGGDLHAIVATEIFGVPVSKEKNANLRERAKAINFGLAYGMGAGGLAQVTGMTLEEADQLLVRYFGAFPRVKAYLDEAARSAVERGFARTIGGRRLYLSVGDAAEEDEAAAAARVAKNMPIQGTNADMLKLAMAGIRRRLLAEGLDAMMVNCVHDEILLEAAEADAWAVAELARQEMIRAGERYIQAVPVEVEVGVAESWTK